MSSRKSLNVSPPGECSFIRIGDQVCGKKVFKFSEFDDYGIYLFTQLYNEGEMGLIAIMYRSTISIFQWLTSCAANKSIPYPFATLYDSGVRHSVTKGSIFFSNSSIPFLDCNLLPSFTIVPIELDEYSIISLSVLSTSSFLECGKVPSASKKGMCNIL